MAEVSVADQVKAIAKRYAEVEEQLPRSIHYLKREEAAGITTVQQAWLNGVGDLLKVATEQTSPPRRELTEATALDPEMTYDGFFVFTRTEAPAADGGADVEETRRYYGETTRPDRWGGRTRDNGVLIREQRKRAHFAPGEPFDTSKAPNVTIPVAKAKEADLTAEEQKVRAKLFEGPTEIARLLQAEGAVVADPFAGIRGDSDRFRLIHGSASPNGRYAVAIGFDHPVDWTKYADKDVEREESFTTENVDDLRNYVVELATKRILGATGGRYFGTRESYNLRQSILSWSDDSSTFVQRYDSKWSYESCHAGRIGAGPKLSGTVDLGAAAEKYAETYLKSKKRKFRGSIGLSVPEVRSDGTIVLQVYGQEPSVPNKGAIYFHLEQTLRLSEQSGKVQLELLKTRLLPNN